jgi:hypothetical protein
MSDYQEVKQLHFELKELADANKRLRLTDEDKEAIAVAARIAGAVGESDIKASLRDLLARHK